MTDAAPSGHIYDGHVLHMRLIPRRHRFRYRVFSLLLDIDRLDALAAGSRLFSHNRFGIVSFHDRDHGPRDAPLVLLVHGNPTWSYLWRKVIAEPPFGWIKSALGFRSFGLRGVEKVRGEWNLVCLALNLKRMSPRMAWQ